MNLRFPTGRLCGAIIGLALAHAAPGGLHTNLGLVLLNALQDQQYRERQVLDPESGEWVDQPAAPEESPAGALEQARSLLARGETRAARQRLEEWVEANSGDDRYYEGVYLLGEALFESQRFYQAYQQYEIVVENTGGELFRAALAREYDVAMAFLSGKKRIVWKFLRLPAYEDALEILDRIWERVPGTRLGETALRTRADYYFNKGEMDLAQEEYANLAREYPGGRFAQLAMYRSAVAAEALFPGIKFDDRPLLEAEERYQQLASAYPSYAQRENVDERLEGIRQQRAEKDLYIARWYEKTRQPAAAEFYYRALLRDWAGTLAAAEAQQRLRALGVELEEEVP